MTSNSPRGQSEKLQCQQRRACRRIIAKDISQESPIIIRALSVLDRKEVGRDEIATGFFKIAVPTALPIVDTASTTSIPRIREVAWCVLCLLGCVFSQARGRWSAL